MTSNAILEVAGITATAPSGTSLLDDVSFSVEPGWLVAVVGPTGAGKTSLAKALLGQLPLDAGSVRVTGSRRARVAGVPQEDATHPQLSLRRTLEHAAALRVDAGSMHRRHSVDSVLAELGLTSRAGTRLSDLSGGERKRANVAVELVGQPDLLVLDEPTAGLDPGFEKSVFSSLRALADSGRTIVAITHSMRVLDVCDRVLFLAPGGTVAFFGTSEEAEAYFDWDDPADAYAALATEPATSWKDRFAAHLTRPTPAAWSGAGRRSHPASTPAAWSGSSRQAHPAGADWSGSSRQNRPAPEATASAAYSADGDGAGHLGTLLRRAVHVASSDRRTLALSLAAGPVIGLLLWAVLPGGTLGPPTGPEGEALDTAPQAITFAFFLAMTITWLAAAGAAREVVKERHILRREVGVGVALSTYLAGKAMFLSGLTALQVIPLAAIAVVHQQAPAAGPALGSGLLEVIVVALLVGVTAVATGLLVSSWASSSEKAMTALPVVLVAQLALAGPWAEDRSAVLEVVRHAVPAKWAASAISATVLGDGSGWWLSALALAAIATLQLAAALVLLHRSSPSTSTSSPEADRNDRFGAVSTRPTTTRPPAIRFVPAGLALVLALAAGAGALGRASENPYPAQEQALARPAPPTTAAPTPPPPAPPAPAPAPSVPAPRPAPTTTQPPPAPAPIPAPRTAPAPAARTTPAPTTPPTTRPPTPPTTTRLTPTTAPPAATAVDPLTQFLQQLFPPPRR